MSDYNIILDTDSYKASHWLQYPPETTSMFSYIESRGGLYDKTVFFGLQYFIKRYLTQRITVADVEKAKEFYAGHGVPFNYEGWMYIAAQLAGKLPAKIRAVLEGSVIPTKNILVSIESTDPKVFWVASWLETMLVRIWHPINVATVSWECKKVIRAFLDETAEKPEEEIAFKLHDFGSRGVSSQESAAIGGAAHLVNFMGSDTVVGVNMANKFYHTKMAGFSIPATEHSTITSWGRDRECDAYRNLIDKYAKPGSLVACVSDSYDIYNAIDKMWGGELKQKVIDSGATIVIRPDSGVPSKVVLECLKMLDEKFGSVVNNKGFKVINNVRVIQGDGINIDSIKEICSTVKEAGYSLTNVAFGMGGALLQQHNRDTQKFAMKCSSVEVAGKEVDVYKDPIDDPGKSSKRGRLDLVCSFSEPPYRHVYETVRIPPGLQEHPCSVMHTVFLNGESMNETTFDDIRQRMSQPLNT